MSQGDRPLHPLMKRINIDKPQYDQSMYIGRLKHFWTTCNPLNLLYSNTQLNHAKDIVTRYKRGEHIPDLTENGLWAQKRIYDSAFHPETGDKMILIGRMSAQAPCNMVITGFMLNFYK